MITAKVGKRPFLELPEKVYEQLRLKPGQTVLVEIVSVGDENIAPQWEWGSAVGRVSKKEMEKDLEETQGIWADDLLIEQAFQELGRDVKQWEELERVASKRAKAKRGVSGHKRDSRSSQGKR